jgi:hypothetical protein
MLDDFRQQADASILDEELPPEPEQTPRRRSSGRFLGMTPFQRFIIAVILLTITCLLSSFCLLVTERVVPPFLY